MIITNPNNSVPANAFDFPVGYNMKENIVQKFLDESMEAWEKEYYE